MSEDFRYLSEEIIEEGNLYICVNFLQNEHGWTLMKFRDVNIELSRGNVCSYYKYSNSDYFIEVIIEEINFEYMDSLKEINFHPSQETWEYYKKYHSG
jgi:aminopeptidase C